MQYKIASFLEEKNKLDNIYDFICYKIIKDIFSEIEILILDFIDNIKIEQNNFNTLQYHTFIDAADMIIRKSYVLPDIETIKKPKIYKRKIKSNIFLYNDFNNILKKEIKLIDFEINEVKSKNYKLCETMKDIFLKTSQNLEYLLSQLNNIDEIANKKIEENNRIDWRPIETVPEDYKATYYLCNEFYKFALFQNKTNFLKKSQISELELYIKNHIKTEIELNINNNIQEYLEQFEIFFYEQDNQLKNEIDIYLFNKIFNLTDEEYNSENLFLNLNIYKEILDVMKKIYEKYKNKNLKNDEFEKLILNCISGIQLEINRFDNIDKEIEEEYLRYLDKMDPELHGRPRETIPEDYYAI